MATIFTNKPAEGHKNDMHAEELVYQEARDAAKKAIKRSCESKDLYVLTYKSMGWIFNTRQRMILD